jgi:DNA-binding transcriptional regulator YiaG
MPLDITALAEIRQLASSGDARRIRETHDIRLREMADDIGVSHPTLSRWETGQRRPHGQAAEIWHRRLFQLQRMSGAAA